MLDNTIITKFELSEREKMLKKQFFQRDESFGKQYLFSRPKENENDSINNNSNLINNSHSLILEQNLNQFKNINLNTSNKKSVNNNTNNKQNQSLSNTIPDIKNITKEEMNKFYEEAGNYLPKSNGGLSSEQINLLLHQNKIMQRNVDALQETNRSLQDFIIYTMKKDSFKNDIKEEEKIQEQEKNDMQYKKLNQILTPLYEHINNLQSQVKELNQKKREDEIKIELDDLIIKDQKTFKPKHAPLLQPREKSMESDKTNKIMMKTISSLKGTMNNLSEEMKRIGSTFNEKMQKVLEDSEKNKLKTIIGSRPKSTVNKSRSRLRNQSSKKDQINNLSLQKEDENQNDSILKNKLDNMDYNSFKSELIDIEKMQEEIVNQYKANAPEFIELKKPKSKIKFSYDLDLELNKIDKQINNIRNAKPKPNIIKKEPHKINKNSKISEKVSNAMNKEKKQKISPNININKKEKEKEKENGRVNPAQKNKIYIDNYNQDLDKKEHEKKMKELNGLSVVDRMNLYKEKMAEQSRKIQEESKNVGNKYNPNLINNNEMNPQNEIGSNHSGITFQKFTKPSQNPNQIKQKNQIKYNPPKVKYGVFESNNENPNDMMNEPINISKNKNQIINPNNIMPDPDKINNMIKNTIDNYLAAAFSNLKPSEAPKINLNNENNIKSPQKNEVQRVIEKEYIIKNVKEVQNIPQPVVINPPPHPQNPEQNNQIFEKFTNLAEKFTNLEEKISKQIYEQKSSFEKKIEIIEKKEKEQIIQPSSPSKQIIMPNTDLISKLVMEKIKDRMNIDLENDIENSNKKKKNKKKPKKKVDIKPKEEEKIENKIDTLDVNKNVKIEELDDMLRMPHKINLAEYEVSQTSSYLSESLQNNNFNFNNNNNNQININKVKINIQENEYNSDIDDTKNDNNYINNSKSNGEIESENGNSSQNNDNINNNINKNFNNQINYNNNSDKNGIDLLTIKNTNEELQNNINILENDSNKNIKNNNKYHDFINFINNNQVNTQNINQNNKNLSPFEDDFFNDSGEK